MGKSGVSGREGRGECAVIPNFSLKVVGQDFRLTSFCGHLAVNFANTLGSGDIIFPEVLQRRPLLRCWAAAILKQLIT